MPEPRERWIASRDETLATVLERLGSTAALAEGRVFVGGRRATRGGEPVRVGDVVEVYDARGAIAELGLLFAGEGLFVVDKPAGIATEPERRGNANTVVALAAAQLGLRVGDVHALSRLDLGVSGAVLLGVDAAARKRVSALRDAGALRRRYVALAVGSPEPERGSWDEPIRRSNKPPLREIGEGGEVALTHYRVVARAPGQTVFSVLALEPETGRTHQLRVHASAHGVPLLGDRSYGGPSRWVAPDGRVHGFERVLLHAAWIQLGDAAPVSSALPALFAEIFAANGGAPAALARAVELEVRL